MQKFAMLFPGQGSQKSGMLAELAAQHPEVESTFAEASEVLGQGLWDIVQHDTEGQLLNQTHITQPVLLTASVAIWRLWQARQAPLPAVLAGHSLGEYSALVCGGVLGFQDAVGLVSQRGRYMQAAVPAGEGAMAAVMGLEPQQVSAICASTTTKEESEVVSVSSFNSPEQTVIAGTAAAVAQAITQCKEAGAKRAVPLPVSVPSHCALMTPAASQLAQELDKVEFAEPQIPIIQNVTGTSTEHSATIKENLIKQLYLPVLWSDSVKMIYQSGIRLAVECGPGRVLCGLAKRTEAELLCHSSDTPAELDNAIAAA